MLVLRFALVTQSRRLSLVHDKAYVNGDWVSAKSGKTFHVYNPADGKIVGSVPEFDEGDTEVAIRAAHEAFKTWSETTAKERSTILRDWFNLMVRHQPEVAEIMTLEAGKPLRDSLTEVSYGSSFIEWFSEEARRVHGEVLTSPSRFKQLLLVRQPIGVVSLITPWNFPMAMLTRKAGAALAAGCTCVVKPPDDAPLTALAMAELAHQAGVPQGVFNVITTAGESVLPVSHLLCRSPLVAGVSFTGSTNVGKAIYAQCATGLKRLGLELGGNAPFIVFDSANIEAAVQGAMACKFRNCGQACISANRLLIQATVFDEFVSKFTQAMQTKLKLGSGLREDTTVGPLTSRAQAQRVAAMVGDAVSKGAKVVVGGKPALDLGENFYEPTLLTDITPDMLCYQEEIFGPVAPCVRFSTEKECLDVANATPLGLAGYVYTGDIAQAWRVARKLELGMVGINEGVIATPEAAFGGIKESGFGREGSHYGIDEFTYIKYMCFGSLF